MRSTERDERREAGIALIVTVLLMLLISALGITALQHAGDEHRFGGSSRQKVTTLYAADSVLSLVQDQLLPAGGGAPVVTPVDQPNLFQNEAGLSISGRTGTSDSAVAQPVQRVGRTILEGTQLNVNASNSFAHGVYRAGVVATDSSGGRVQVQAQYTVPEGSAGGYR